MLTAGTGDVVAIGKKSYIKITDHINRLIVLIFSPIPDGRRLNLDLISTK